MPKYLVTWKAVNSRFSENVEAKAKQLKAFAQLIQEALKSGALKDWGIEGDGMKGYGIFEGSETEGALMAMMYTPFYEFEIHSVLTADQWMEVLNTVA
jgi:hypothetical protein